MRSRLNVVLVGIDRYVDRDVPDTWGARADVAHLWRTCVDQLQVPPERIEIVTPQRMSPEELVAGVQSHRAEWLRIAERTVRHDGARAAELRRVFDGVAERTGDGDAAWVHFSGHGTTIARSDTLADLVLCAEDFGAPGPGAVSFLDLERTFGGREGAGRLTLTLDCCWTGGDGRAAHPALLPVPFRVLVGTSPDHVARVVRLAGVEHGAFSWALGVALSRWTRTQRADSNELTVTHADLLAWVRQLLVHGLGVDQQPVLAGPRAVDSLAVFAPGVEPGLAGRTHASPDRYDPRRQLWGGTEDVAIYAIRWNPPGGSPEPLGHVIVDGSDAPGVEVWELRSGQLWRVLHAAAAGAPGDLVFSRVPQAPPTSPHTVSWQLVQDEEPFHPPSGAEAAAELIFRTETGSFVAMLGLRYAAAGPDYVLEAVRWWASERATPLTLDPVQGSDPAVYSGSTEPQPLAPTDWAWRPQAVNQLVPAPEGAGG